MERDELVALVERIIAVDVDTEAEHDALIELLEANVPRPDVTDLIYWPEHARDVGRRLAPGEALTPEEIVDIALSYTPIKLGPAPE